MGNRGRKATEDGALLKRYAGRYGVCLKTARAHRERNEGAWRSFVQSEAVAPVVDAPSATGVARLEKVQADAWRQYLSLVAQYDRAVDNKCGPDTLGKYERAVRSAQDRYEAAIVAVERARETAGMLVPYETVKAFAQAIEPLGEFYDSLKDIIAGRMKDPVAEDIFYKAWDASAAEWDELVEKLNKKIASVLPCF